MRDCVIIGSGRSGTSMMTGLFARAGYFIGDDVRPAGPGNSRGYFESEEVNRINEELLDQIMPPRPSDRVRRRLYRWQPRRFQRWAARPKRARYSLTVSPDLAGRMRHQAQSPFCLKDPRLCWTLPAWRDALGDALFVCIFRHPDETVDSIFKIGRIQRGLRDYMMRRGELRRVWRDMYTNALRWADENPGDWVFIDYDDVLQDPAVIAAVAELSGAPLSSDGIDPGERSVTRRSDGIPRPCREVYMELRARSARGVEAGQRAR